MHRKWILAIVLALGLLAVTAAVALSWSAVDQTSGAGPDFMVSLPLNDQADPSVAYNSSDDEYLVVWWDDRGSDSDIYGQIFAASGIPQDDNFVVSNGADEQSDPLVAYNSTDNNYMVVWQDKRDSAKYDVYGQVISATGVLSGANFAINTDGGGQETWDLIYDQNANHYLVMWVDDGDNWVEGQLLDQTGGLIGTSPFTITNVGGLHPRAAYNSHRFSYMAVYQHGGDIYGQAIAGDGSLSDPAFVICDATADQVKPNLEFNSNSDVYEYLVVWGDERDDHWDIYGRRIDEDGAPQGDEIVVCNASDDQYGPDVTYNVRVNQWLVSWYDYRDQNASGADIYGQRVKADGSLAGQGNFAIYDGPNNQRSVALVARPKLVGAEYLAVWQDHRSGDGLEVVGQRISVLGTLNWHDFNVSAPLESQENPRVAYNSTDQQFLVVWQDERDGDSDIYAQIVLTTGIPITDNIVVQNVGHQLVDPAVAYGPISNTYVVVWHDQDDGDIDERVVNADGTLGSVHSVIVAGTQPAIAYNSTADEYLIVFASPETGDKDIKGRRVAIDGTFVSTVFTISVNTADQSLPQVTYNGTDDEYLVVWSDARTDQGDIYGRRVDADETLLGDDDFLIAADTDAQTAPSVAWNSDDNEYLVVWHDYRDSGTTGSDIYGQRLNNTGGLEGSNFALCTASDYQMYPRVTYISTYGRYSVIWGDDRNVATGWDIYRQNVNADGSLYLGNLAFFVFSGYQQRPDGAFSPEANRGLTVWQDGRNGATYKIYGRLKEPRFPIYLPLVLRDF